MEKRHLGVPGTLCRWACIAATLVMAQPLFAQEAGTKTYLFDWNVCRPRVENPRETSWLWNPEKNTYKAILELGSKGSPFNTKRSTTGDVAFLLATEDPGGGPRNDSLQLILRTGDIKELARAEQIRDFQWSPNGTAIAHTAFVKGTDAMSIPLKVTIVNIVTGEAKRVPANGDQIHWARFDGMLYIRVESTRFKGVLRYDPASGALEKTKYQSLMFSPDGKYYFEAPYYEEEDRPLVIRVRETNAVLTEGDHSLIPYLASLRLKAWFWLDNGLIAATVPSSGTAGSWYALNVETGQIRKTENELLELWKPDKVVVKKKDGSGLALETISEMPIIKPEDLPQSWFKELEAKYSGK